MGEPVVKDNQVIIFCYQLAVITFTFLSTKKSTKFQRYLERTGVSLFQLIELTEVTEDTIELEDEDIFDGEDELFQVIDLWLKIINIISCLFSRKKEALQRNFISEKFKEFLSRLILAKLKMSLKRKLFAIFLRYRENQEEGYS